MENGLKKFNKIKIMAIEKTLQIFARIGFSDIVVSLEDARDNDKKLVGLDSFLVGYEDEDGRECDEDGIYLRQNHRDQLGLPLDFNED